MIWYSNYIYTNQNRHTIDTVTDNILNGNGIKSSRDEDFLSRTPDKKSSFVPMMGLHHDSHLHEPSANYNKRPSLYDTIAEQFTPIDEYTNNAIEDDDCPLLDTMEKRCRAINLLSGDVHQQFLPLCGVHQLCYLCVSISEKKHLAVCFLKPSSSYRALHNRRAISSTWTRRTPYAATIRHASTQPKLRWWCCATRPACRLDRMNACAIRVWNAPWLILVSFKATVV